MEINMPPDINSYSSLCVVYKNSILKRSQVGTIAPLGAESILEMFLKLSLDMAIRFWIMSDHVPQFIAYLKKK